MNQFKQAKQLREKSGQAIESITDIKTAGISTKEEIKEEIKEENSLIDFSENEHQENDTEIKTLSNEVLNNSTTIINTENSTNKKSDESDNVNSEPNLQTEDTRISMEQMSALVPSQIDVEAPLSQPTEPSVISTIIDTPNTSPVPPLLQETIIAPAIHNVTQTPQLQNEYYQYAAPIPPKDTKKSIPNIFSPKGESKSTRKSLVLKPTSVKIAEDYCAKNGGSFNELIETLLDNFINEYGL